MQLVLKPVTGKRIILPRRYRGNSVELLQRCLLVVSLRQYGLTLCLLVRLLCKAVMLRLTMRRLTLILRLYFRPIPSIYRRLRRLTFRIFALLSKYRGGWSVTPAPGLATPNLYRLILESLPVMSGYNVPSTSEDLSPLLLCLRCCRHRRLTQRVLKVIWQVMVCLPRPPFVVNTVLQSMALSWAFCLSCRALCINRAWIVSGCAVLVMISISQSLLTSRSRLYLIASCMQTTVESTNKAIFGYQGRYDEMRTKRNMVCGQMRSTFDYWHLGRIFSSQPALNESFIQCVPTNVFLPLLRSPGSSFSLQI